MLPFVSTVEAFHLKTVDPNGTPIDDTNAWRTVFAVITNHNSRNLFYFGHGGANGIGGYPNPGNGYGISAKELMDGLNNQPFLYMMVGGPRPNPHRYRFVYVSGCSTADGLLPFAFGVTNNRDPDLHPYSPGEGRPSAYLGFSGKVQVGVRNTGIYLHHPNYVAHLWTEWALNGRTLDDARQHAYDDYVNIDVAGFPIGKLKIVRYRQLHFNEANTNP